MENTKMVNLYLEMEGMLNDGLTDDSTMKIILDRICAYFDKDDSDCMEFIMTETEKNPHINEVKQ
tara:strand:- start:167 stop:361 length:195 start_codon:yes stop_codon:yes gene_type:complete